MNDKYAICINTKVITFLLAPPKGAEITAEEPMQSLFTLISALLVVGELATPIRRDSPQERDCLGYGHMADYRDYQ